MSRTSGEGGHTPILTGQTNVKVNGLMAGRHDSLALINCDANGCGGALGQLHTEIKPLSLIEQITRDANKTPEQLREDMDWHRQGQADANARANDIDRQIADLRAQANRASSWNPFNAERRAINTRIDALQASQRSAASTALWHNEQALRTFDRLHPEAAGGPVMSASPTAQEARELDRRAADVQRGWDRIDAARGGPGGALAVMAGVPPEMAQAINTVTSMGRRPGSSARPVTTRNLPRRTAQTTTPAPRTPPPPRPAATPPRPGVYVRPPPRTPVIKVRCFKKNSKGSPTEYDRQLADQERGLNELSVKDYLEGRARYQAIGRKGTGAAQEKARAEYAKELTDKFERELRSSGASRALAQQQAAAMASTRMKTLAALHSPDMIAGGKDVVTSMGDRGVNSSIGSQWKNRVATLDREALKVPENDRASTQMNGRLVRCK